MRLTDLLPAATAAALTAALPAQAAETRACEGFETSAQFVTWDDPTRTWANGDVRFVSLDTYGEPTCCSAHLMVIHPLPDEPFPACTMVSADGGAGWAGLSLAGARATYDPAAGLTVTVPVGIYNGAGSDPGTVTVTVNMAAGTVTAD